MRSTRSIIVFMIWLAMVGLPPRSVAAAPALALEAARVERVTLEQVFDGVIEAVHRATVSAQTSGRIDAVEFDVGDYVPKGSVILRLRDQEQRSRLEAAQAGLREAQARDKEAAAEFERIQGIYQKKLIAKAALDKAAADLKAVRARLAAAQARVKEAAEQLEHTVVRAPYSGIVVQRHVEIGETARPGQALMTGLSLETLRAVANVPQTAVDAVLARNRARVIFTHQGGRSVEAERLTLVPCATGACHTFQIRVYLPPAQEGIYPGMFVKVAFVTGARERLVVPAVAVVRRSEVTAVYVVGADGAIALRQVRAGATFGDGLTEVLAGLEPGEQIALDPVRAGVLLKERAGKGL